MSQIHRLTRFMMSIALCMHCAPSRERVETEHVFSPDSRLTLSSEDTPWSAIGRVEDRTGTWCTGALVAPDLVLTNAHCVLDDFGALRADLSFCPAFRNGRCRHRSFATHTWWGTANPRANRASDWAILRLRSPLGLTYGTFPIRRETLAPNEEVSLVSYSTDFQNGTAPAIQQTCHVMGEEFGYYLHDCDMTSGASGSPLLQERDGRMEIVALNAAEYCPTGAVCESLRGVDFEHSIANLAVKTTAFLSHLRPEPLPSTLLLHLCNETPIPTIYAAIGYHHGDWISKGWFELSHQTCREVPFPSDFQGTIYVYAEYGSTHWTGNGRTKNLCVHRFGPFEMQASDDVCERDPFDHKVERFGAALEIAPGSVNTWVFR